MALGTKVTGLKINSTAKVLRNGLMEHLTMANMLMARNTAEASSLGQIIQLSLVTSLITTSMAMVSMNGLTVESTQVTGRTIRWKATALSPGLMAGNTWDNILMI